jgi:hypothetical protein
MSAENQNAKRRVAVAFLVHTVMPKPKVQHYAATAVAASPGAAAAPAAAPEAQACADGDEFWLSDFLGWYRALDREPERLRARERVAQLPPPRVPSPSSSPPPQPTGFDAAYARLRGLPVPCDTPGAAAEAVAVDAKPLG